jgi:hypothetical protein
MKTTAPAHEGKSPSALDFMEPTDTAATLDGIPWGRLLEDGEDPTRVINALLQGIRADLKSWTGQTANILVDHAAKTITMESRSPAPEGTVVFRASITLCIDGLTTESEGRRLSVLPRIVAGTLLWKDGVAWIVHGAEAQFAGYLEQIQERLGGLSL